MENEDRPPLRSAKESPYEVKELMIRAMASNACMGIVQAAIGVLEEHGWSLTRMLHEIWMDEDRHYRETIEKLQEVGKKAQKDGCIMAALSMMPDDAQILKWMLTNFVGIAPEPKTGEKTAKSKFEEMDEAELLAKFREFQGKNLKVV